MKVGRRHQPEPCAGRRCWAVRRAGRQANEIPCRGRGSAAGQLRNGRRAVVVAGERADRVRAGAVHAGHAAGALPRFSLGPVGHCMPPIPTPGAVYF